MKKKLILFLLFLALILTDNLKASQHSFQISIISTTNITEYKNNIFENTEYQPSVFYYPTIIDNFFNKNHFFGDLFFIIFIVSIIFVIVATIFTLAILFA